MLRFIPPAILIIAFSLFTYLIIYTSYQAHKRQELQRFGVLVLERTLREQHAIVDNYWGVEFVSEFERGKEYNYASVMYLDKRMSRRDYNKSRIIGEYTAEKGKEFFGGLIDGIFKKNEKHSVDSDE